MEVPPILKNPDQLESVPESILLHIFSFLEEVDLIRLTEVCAKWNRIVMDESLWKARVYKKWKTSGPIAPRKKSWLSEYKRLEYHAPRMESEVLTDHEDQVLHVSFSHDGNMFASSSKDGHVKVWNAKYPATVLGDFDMREFNWEYTQFSQFNKIDTLLLVCGKNRGSQSTGEITLFRIDGFAPMISVWYNPYDVFSAWDDPYCFFSGRTFYYGGGNSVTVIWKTIFPQISEPEPLKRYHFYNKHYSSLRSIMLAQFVRRDLPLDSSNLNTNDSCDEEDLLAFGPRDCSNYEPPRREKYLIFTSGSETWIPHVICFKKIEFTNGSPLDGEFAFDEVDHSVDMRGHIVGMALSPDHRHLYVNNRKWPENSFIEDPSKPPPIDENIVINTIDLYTFNIVGPTLTSHKGYTSTDDCFFIFLNVSEELVTSGSEDNSAYLWDRHYGSCLARLPHEGVVNCAVFNPVDSEMLVTASDDGSLKVWRSPNRMKEMNQF